MKRIAFISEHASPLVPPGKVDAGGQNVYIRHVAAHLGRLGYRVDIFTRMDDPLLPPVVECGNGVRVIHVKAGPPTCIRKEELFPWMDEFTAEMSRYIRRKEIRYDLIHAHFWMSGYVAALLSATFDIPFVITFHALGKIRRMHQGKDDLFPDVRFAVEESIVRRAATILAECPQDRDDLVNFYQADPAKIAVIPCGYDESEFPRVTREEAREIARVREDEFVILQLGRMVPRKGIDTVIRAVALLKRRVRRKIKLLIVGGDAMRGSEMQSPEYLRLKALAAQSNLATETVFTGFRERELIRYYYSAADVFVTTPWYEPFGITPLEAMACATPVIGSNVGGIKFSVRDGETGFLVPPKDPVALSDKLEILCSYPMLARKLGVQGRKHVSANFTWNRIAAAIADEYRAVLGERKRGVVPVPASAPLSVPDLIH